MIRIARPALLLLAMIAGLLITVQPAEAATIANPWRYASRTVYVQSSLSPTTYPVGRAVEMWDNYSRLNLVLVQKCPAGKPCIRFVAGRQPGGLVGKSWSVVDGYTILRCSIEIDTRDLNGLPKLRRLSTLAHEAGHCLGFPHTSRSNDVMFSSNTATRPWQASSGYYSALRRLYGS